MSATLAFPGSGLLSELFGEPIDDPTVYLLILDGADPVLIERSDAQRIFNDLDADWLAHVSGGLELGYCWSDFGVHPPRRHVVRPVRVTGLQDAGPLHVAIELTWPPNLDGRVRSRRFAGMFPDQQTAYLALCCLWSSTTGRGATEAALVDVGGVAYPIEESSRTCGLVDPCLIAALLATETELMTLDRPPERLAATAPDHETTGPMPGCPRPLRGGAL
jgi:hypothetical protein